MQHSVERYGWKRRVVGVGGAACGSRCGPRTAAHGTEEIACDRDWQAGDADEVLLPSHVRKVVEGLDSSLRKPGFTPIGQVELCDECHDIGREP